MKNFKKAFVFVAAAIAVCMLAITMKTYHLNAGIATSGKSDVSLNVTVRGSGGRPVRNAVISVFDSEQKTLGKTDGTGTLSMKVLLTSGRSLILQADGVAFKMQRTILVPRSATYRSSVFFDLAEVHEGNATLISSENSESTSLVKSPVARRTLTMKLEKMTLSEESRSSLESLLQQAAPKVGFASNTTLSCQSLESSAMLHECEMVFPTKTSEFRLFQTLPTTPESAETWLKAFLKKNPNSVSNTLLPSELILLIRHNGQKFRAYLDEMPLVFWKEKQDSLIFKNQVNRFPTTPVELNLTVLTDSGKVLQKNIRLPHKNRLHSLRIPRTDVHLELSKREQRLNPSAN